MTRSSTDDLGIPKDPATQPCAWCSKVTELNSAWEIFKNEKQIRQGVGTAQFVYACPAHEALAQKSSRAPRRAA